MSTSDSHTQAPDPHGHGHGHGEESRQRRADAGADRGDGAAVRQYREVARAVRQAAMPPIPADFAARSAGAAAEAARADRASGPWLWMAPLAALLVYGLASCWPALQARWTVLLDGPWPVLIAAAAAIGAASRLERGRSAVAP